MILTSQANSPSLRLIEEPHSKNGVHHLLDYLLEHQPFLQVTQSDSVNLNIKSITTESTLITTSTDTSLPLSTTIAQPLISAIPSMTTITISQPLIK